jgi:hypothetical protein
MTNFFQDPVEWASKMVGRRWRYVVASCSTVITGVLLTLGAVHLVSAQGASRQVGTAVVFGVFTVLFPLMYLYALRACVRRIAEQAGREP